MRRRLTPRPVPSVVALAACPDPALIVDRRRVVVAANEAFRSQFSPGRKVVGRRCFEVVHGCSTTCACPGEVCPVAAARASRREQRTVHVHPSPWGPRCVEVVVRFTNPRTRAPLLLAIRTVDEVSVEPSGAKLVGQGQTFLAMVEQMRRVAPGDHPVLLVGEAGTGKELVARTIHAMSSRHAQPFVVVDCARAVDLSFQSDLASGRAPHTEVRLDALETAAQRGTLFLKDIDALPVALQGPLLRIIESRTCAVAATGEQRSTDIRVMCAIDCPPTEAVAAGRLRRDLADALAVTVTVPSLRARPEDIPLLTGSLLARIASSRPYRVDPRAAAWLQQYSYPGNVRELAAILESATRLAPGDVILPEHLPPQVAVGTREARSVRPRRR